MKTAAHAEDDAIVHSSPPAPTAEEIGAQLRLILASPVFHGSKRCQQFLEYVCRKALAGDAGALKERSIAVDVFGRSPDTAANGEDTIVRVGAREVRKRLAQYYVTPEGAASQIILDLPPGSYAPEFRYSGTGRTSPVSTPAAPATIEIIAPPPEPPAEPKKRHRIWIVAAACVAVAAIGIFAVSKWTGRDVRDTAFERFWAPVFKSSSPLLIGVGHPIVYQPSRRASLLNAKRLPPTPFPIQRKLELPPKELDGSDIVPVLNQFVGFGDMVAANEVAQMLAGKSHKVRLLLASSIPFADLMQSQAYLIGSLSNHWTMELGQNWRYQFAWTPEHDPIIKDTAAGSPRQWSIPSHDDGSTPEDYSLICRIRNSPTGGLLIVSAGIKQFGTEAAGRLLADPAQLGAILNHLPAGWEDKNVQVVLHMKVIGNTPAQPEVVASHVW